MSHLSGCKIPWCVWCYQNSIWLLHNDFPKVSLHDVNSEHWAWQSSRSIFGKTLSPRVGIPEMCRVRGWALILMGPSQLGGFCEKISLFWLLWQEWPHQISGGLQGVYIHKNTLYISVCTARWGRDLGFARGGDSRSCSSLCSVPGCVQSRYWVQATTSAEWLIRIRGLGSVLNESVWWNVHRWHHRSELHLDPPGASTALVQDLEMPSLG